MRHNQLKPCYLIKLHTLGWLEERNACAIELTRLKCFVEKAKDPWVEMPRDPLQIESRLILNLPVPDLPRS